MSETTGPSPKMLLATMTTAFLSVLVAIANAVQANPALLGSLPTWVQTVILGLVPPVLVGLAAYAASPGVVVETPSGRHAEADGGSEGL